VESGVLGGNGGRNARNDTLVPVTYGFMRVTTTLVRESHPTLPQSTVLTAGAKAAVVVWFNLLIGKATVMSEETVTPGASEGMEAFTGTMVIVRQVCPVETPQKASIVKR
jgi:hypothetical protein